MGKLLSIVDGWTGALGPFTLRVNGTPINLTGFTVVPIVRNPLGALVTLGGTLTVLNQTSFPGQVTYASVVGDFLYATGVSSVREPRYTIHFKVTDGAGKIVFFPNGIADEIEVSKT